MFRPGRLNAWGLVAGRQRRRPRHFYIVCHDMREEVSCAPHKQLCLSSFARATTSKKKKLFGSSFQTVVPKLDEEETLTYYRRPSTVHIFFR
jgi:hypothetical protein